MEFEKGEKWINETNLCGHYDSVSCILVWKWNNENAMISSSITHNQMQIKCGHLEEEENQIDILFSGSQDRSIRIWNLSNGDCLSKWINVHCNAVNCLKQWTDRLISGGSNNMIYIWKIDEKTLNVNQPTRTSLQQGDCISAIIPQYYELITGLEIWNNSLVSVSSDKSICIWKYKQQQQLNLDNSNFICSQQIVCETQINCVKLWNDCIVTGFNYGFTNCLIGIWKNKSNGNTIHLFNQFFGHKNSVYCLEVWNENSNQLISGSRDETIRLWNSDGKCLSIFSGHAGIICSIVVWNNILFSGCSDFTIKVWDSNGNCLTTLTDHTDIVFCLIICKDKLISGSLDNSIKLWIRK